MPAFLLPDLGEGLTEAEIVTWHVQAGDTVAVDQPIVEVETAKAMVEVPVPFAGRVTALHGQPGDVVAVGAPLVTVDTAAGSPSRASWWPRPAPIRAVRIRAALIRTQRAATSSSATERPAGTVAVTGRRGHRLRPTAGCPLPRR